VTYESFKGLEMKLGASFSLKTMIISPKYLDEQSSKEGGLKLQFKSHHRSHFKHSLFIRYVEPQNRSQSTLSRQSEYVKNTHF
jgi:hypothetical protein